MGLIFPVPVYFGALPPISKSAPPGMKGRSAVGVDMVD